MIIVTARFPAGNTVRKGFANPVMARGAARMFTRKGATVTVTQM